MSLSKTLIKTVCDSLRLEVEKSGLKPENIALITYITPAFTFKALTSDTFAIATVSANGEIAGRLPKNFVRMLKSCLKLYFPNAKLRCKRKKDFQSNIYNKV